MNERIEHYLYEAGLTAQGCWDEMDDYDRKAIEKFAELIIKECAKVCEKQVAGAVGTYAGVHNNAVGACIKGIKEHFGVE